MSASLSTKAGRGESPGHSLYKLSRLSPNSIASATGRPCPALSSFERNVSHGELKRFMSTTAVNAGHGRGDESPGSLNCNDDAPIHLVRDAVRRVHQRLALAARRRLDLFGGN